MFSLDKFLHVDGKDIILPRVADINSENADFRSFEAASGIRYRN
jgi:hypothetical protein